MAFPLGGGHLLSAQGSPRRPKPRDAHSAEQGSCRGEYHVSGALLFALSGGAQRLGQDAAHDASSSSARSMSAASAKCW